MDDRCNVVHEALFAQVPTPSLARDEPTPRRQGTEQAPLPGAWRSEWRGWCCPERQEEAILRKARPSELGVGPQGEKKARVGKE